MNCAPPLLHRVLEICREIDQTPSLEALYENLAHYLARLGDAPASAFMTVVKHGAAGYNLRISQGTGRYANAAGAALHDDLIRERLRNALGQRANQYDPGAVTFYFSHPDGFAILVYVEGLGEIDAESMKLLAFIDDKVVGSIRMHSLATQANRTGRAMVLALAGLAEHKDQDTGDHILRMAIMTDEIVQILVEQGHYLEEITPEFKRHIGTASILHDVGKVAIPDSILKKPALLDPEERAIIETHTVHGKKALEKASRILDGNDYLLNLSSEIALHHHEYYNGQGYPARLAGQDIPLSARIVGLVDVFDALITERPYKRAWTEQEAISYVTEQSGKQFDPLLVEALHKVMEYRKGSVPIQWTVALSVKDSDMDNDHRCLIDLINQLASAEKIGNRHIVESVLDKLLDYTIDHFHREEGHMQKSGYRFPELEAHKRQHTAFAQTIKDIRWQYLHGFHSRINQEVLLLLREWLSRHILTEDMKYSVPA